MQGHDGHSGMDMPMEPFRWGEALHLSWEPVWLAITALSAGAYLYGVLRLRRRGDRWPLGRTVSWLLGTATVFLVTCTQLGRYSMAMFSLHMIQHMVLSMLSPILLLLGGPVTLALRALPPSGVRGRKGPREWLVWLLHTRYVRIISSPFATLPIFIASLYGVYFTPLFDWMMGSSLGHFLMLSHFVAVGMLFFWPIMGVDPGPSRSGHLMRIIELFMGMPFHAFFGIAVMMATELLVTTFAASSKAIGVDALADQSAAGGIAWAFSEVPSVIVLIALVRQWAKSDERTARRKDRAADRDGDAELIAYNAYLERLQQQAAERQAAGR